MEKINLKGKDFLSLFDFSKEEILYLINLAAKVKEEKRKGKFPLRLKNKNILLLFEKMSTRTRSSFEVGAKDEGASTTFLGPDSSHFGTKESLEDSAKVFSRFYDGIEYRGFSQETVQGLADYADIPVWNGLTDFDHPTQILADLLTIKELSEKPFSALKICFIGDSRNNMVNAWMFAAAKLGLSFFAIGPKELSPDRTVLSMISEEAAKSGAEIIYSEDLAACEGADVIYSDIWASMGEENLVEERVKLLSPYRITMDVIKQTKNDDVLFLHCLPSFHDFETKVAKDWMDKGVDIREVTDEVFRSKHSVVFDEAENRMHTIKAVMLATLT
jgi:ornithine carbamoyltransferase